MTITGKYHVHIDHAKPLFKYEGRHENNYPKHINRSTEIASIGIHVTYLNMDSKLERKRNLKAISESSALHILKSSI